MQVPILQIQDKINLENYNNDDIYLITQFYIPSNDEKRQNEIKTCLRRNLESSFFKIIFLVIEKEYTKEELGINEKEMKKIQQVIFNSGTRLKYSQTLGNGYFGTTRAQGTKYFQLDARVPTVVVKNLSIVAHAVKTDVANSSSADYKDYNVGFAYALPQGWEGKAVYYTNSGMNTAFQTANTTNGQKNYKNAVVFSVAKAF
jgi:hypothetical protein